MKERMQYSKKFRSQRIKKIVSLTVEVKANLVSDRVKYKNIYTRIYTPKAAFLRGDEHIYAFTVL